MRFTTVLNICAGLFALFISTAKADIIQATVDTRLPDAQGCSIGAGSVSGDNVIQSVGSGTATASATCTYSNGAIATYSASSAINSLGASVSLTGPGLSGLNVGSFASSEYSQELTFMGLASSVTCPGGNGVVECFGGGALTDPKAGTPLQGVFDFTENGTMSGDFFAGFSPVSFSIDACGQSLLNTHSTGLLASSPCSFKVGVPVSFVATFTIQIACHGDCSADFSDPELTDVAIMDPATGLPVLGLTAVGDDGTIYPTNVGIQSPVTTPEPSSLGFVIIAVIGIGLASRRQVKNVSKGRC
jgi:hypothetical protein